MITERIALLIYNNFIEWIQQWITLKRKKILEALYL